MEKPMIELTQEQWQAIAREEHPTVIEPESKKAYVVVLKDEYDKLRAVCDTEADAAYVLRVAWMRRMRLDEDEIAESIRDDPPMSVQEEMKQIKALDHLDKITPPGEVLRKYAVKY
jgi:hypothetical protein